MAANSLIVNVLITKSTRTVSQQNFGLFAIGGPSARLTAGTYAVYNSASSMLATAGGPFQSSDPEYIEALAATSQAIVPSQFVVFPYTAAVAQVDTFQVGTLTTGHQYKFTMNSVVISYTSSGGDTQQSILNSLLTAIGVAFPSNPPVTGAVVGTGPSATLTLTSTVAGVGISYTSIDSSLTHVLATPNHSIVQDIQTMQAAVPPSLLPYGLIICSHIAADILQIAAYIETQLMVYVTATLDAGCLTNSTTDIMSVLKAGSYDRTMILYSAQCNTNGPDGAWMGYMLPTVPGSSNWADKTLVGVTPDNLNATQIANVVSKNGNIYVTVGGNGLTLYGIAPGAQYLDTAIFLDWLASTIQTGMISVITDPLNLKIPYTNQGIGMLQNPIRAALQAGQDNNGLVPGWTIFAPDINNVSHTDKVNRVLNNIGFQAQLAGAINVVNVQGFVSS
jgi:hypothetical protein